MLPWLEQKRHIVGGWKKNPTKPLCHIARKCQKKIYIIDTVATHGHSTSIT
jgi:hypothetical protein